MQRINTKIRQKDSRRTLSPTGNTQGSKKTKRSSDKNIEDDFAEEQAKGSANDSQTE